MYRKMLRNLEIPRIGVRGVTPYGRLIRVKRESVLRLRGQPETPSAELSRWVTINQAAEHYQVSTRLIRELIAHEQLNARRIGDSKIIRIERDSLLALGRLRRWGADSRPWSVPARPAHDQQPRCPAWSGSTANNTGLDPVPVGI
jgi:hypothetical protein